MLPLKTSSLLALLLAAVSGCGFHKSPVHRLPRTEQQPQKTLFIAFDGISYDTMAKLKAAGYFKDFQAPKPMVVPFPSATTIGFTGIFKPLGVGKVPGYEVRFYSHDQNKIIGGTPKDIYKIKINYKTYFDYFRHTVYEKSLMYAFPGVAGQQDLFETERLLLNNPKKILFSYLGSTDGAQHILGEKRALRFMVFADRFIERMKKKYAALGGLPLRIVMFSDHGFHFEDNIRIVSHQKVSQALGKHGIHLAPRLKGKNDAVLVAFGLLSAGVMFSHPDKKAAIGRWLPTIDGIELAFWPEEEEHKIMIINSDGEEAYFEYRGISQYRYVTLRGDPLRYNKLLSWHGKKEGAWMDKDTWFKVSWNHEYPDAGYRLYDSFHNLVRNKANVMFSLKPAYQYGSFAAMAGTQLKWHGHKGTHGGIFRDVSWGFMMTDDSRMRLPEAVRYDDFFKLFLPEVVRFTAPKL